MKDIQSRLAERGVEMYAQQHNNRLNTLERVGLFARFWKAFRALISNLVDLGGSRGLYL